MIALLAAVALGGDLTVSGDLKGFHVAVFPYEHLLMPPDPMLQSVVDGRLKLRGSLGDALTLEVHHAVSALSSPPGVGPFETGVAGEIPEAVPLTWRAWEDVDGFTLQGRTDRLVATVRGPGILVALGRQPVTFGHGMFFTPLDLVNPFFPTTIDQEYKPGVDALRADFFPGETGRITLVGAYAGDWEPRGMVFAAYGQTTLGLTDLGAFVGAIHADAVLGGTVTSSAGAVGLHGDATLTLPPDGEAPFVRAVAGVLLRPTGTTTVTAELYLQTLGAAEPSEYLVLAGRERWTRGELWLLGRAYAGAAVQQKLFPTLHAGLAAFANLADPSAFVAPSLSWSVADNADVGLGGFFGIGARPEQVSPGDLFGVEGEEVLRRLGVRSEFGIYPSVGFVQVRTYF